MDTRKYWVDLMLRIAEPVLTALAERRLQRDLPKTFRPERAKFRGLEAFGRTMCGIAPWLELEGLTGEEAEHQARLRHLAREAIDSATDPESPDFLDFSTNGQPLVDAAFLAHGIVRAPRELLEKLEPRVKENLKAALISSRYITPCDNNWVLFASMVETALHLMGEEIMFLRVYNAVSKFSDQWYLGDGTYSDGPLYHFDYYNSFVIHPMYIDTIRAFDRYTELIPEALRRASRYAAIQERMIAPDGTYILIGRSICYRFGAFQLLSQAILQDFLPEEISPAQVRCALTAVLKKCEEGGMFNEDGWLLPGVYGNQPGLAELYINTGSLYLCSAVFLVLGTGPDHPFWNAPDEPWTQKKLWSGVDLKYDEYIK